MNDLKSIQEEIRICQKTLDNLKKQEAKLIAQQDRPIELLGTYVKYSKNAIKYYMHITAIRDNYLGPGFILTGPCVTVLDRDSVISYTIYQHDICPLNSEVEKSSEEEFNGILEEAIKKIKSKSNDFTKCS